MLKAEIKTILLLLLLLQVDWIALTSYVLPVFAGLCIYTGQQIRRGTLSAKGFLVKMLFVIGLCPMVYFVYRAFNIKWDISLVLFGVTFLSDAIVTQGYKAGEVGVSNYFGGMFKNNNNNER